MKKQDKLKFQTLQVQPDYVKSELLIVGQFEGTDGARACNLPEQSVSRLAQQAGEENFHGQMGRTLVFVPSGAFHARRVLYFGLGKKAEFSLKRLRDAIVTAVRKAQKMNVSEIAYTAIDLDGTGISPEVYGQTLAEYTGMCDYVINHFKTERAGHKAETRLQLVSLVTEAPDVEARAPWVKKARLAMEDGLAKGRVIADAVNYARDLGNLPACICTPEYLANEARKLARASRGRLQVTVLDRSAIEKLGMNAYLAVSRGSAVPPYFIELSYTPTSAKNKDVLGMVGKSITYDSGGLDIKTSGNMGKMKADMAGGAAVLAAMKAIVALKLPVRVKAYMAATENMPSGTAYKAGDVLVSMDGLTIEVDNTDAEGRLTLADAITYAKREGEVTHLIDLATLTGAMKAALGSIAAGAFGNNQSWMNVVKSAAASSGERIWQMPMDEEYARANDSVIADLKNSGGAAFGAGSITAAWFIRKFAGETPWVHLDIANVSNADREVGANPKECTGFGTRTLVQLAEVFAGMGGAKSQARKGLTSADLDILARASELEDEEDGAGE